MAGEGREVLPGISTLVGASLVQPLADVSDEPRFTLLETIREYALEQLCAQGEERQTRDAHADYYRWLAESALPRCDGPDLDRANAQVERDLDNCRAAMAWALDQEVSDRQAAETAVRLAGALWRVWWFRQALSLKPTLERQREGCSWCERALRRREGLPVAAVTEALAGAGFLRLYGQMDRAPIRPLGEELLARARAESYPYGCWWALYLLGCLAEEEGQIDEAVIYLTEARAIAPAVRNPENHAAMSLWELGWIADGAGDLDRAAVLLDEAAALFRRAGNPFNLAKALLVLGSVRRRQERLKDALVLLREALVLHEGLQYLSFVRMTLVELAELATAAGQSELAGRVLGFADTLPGHTMEQEEFAAARAAVQRRLSTAAFTTVWEAGAHLTWADLLADLDQLASVTASLESGSPAGASFPHGLSPREADVLRLLADGRSNQEIADALFISLRTVAGHVSSILAKLDLPSRAAAVAFAIRHELA